MAGQAERCAVVTGGGSGIGEGVSRRFARDGHKVAILDIDLENAERAAAEIRAAGGIAQAYRADVSSRADIEAAIGAARPTQPLPSSAASAPLVRHWLHLRNAKVLLRVS